MGAERGLTDCLVQAIPKAKGDRISTQLGLAGPGSEYGRMPLGRSTLAGRPVTELFDLADREDPANVQSERQRAICPGSTAA